MFRLSHIPSYLVHQYLEITLINAWRSIFSLLRIRRFVVENRYALKTYSSAQSQNFEIVVSFASSYKWSLRAHRCNKSETFDLDVLRPEEYIFFREKSETLVQKTQSCASLIHPFYVFVGLPYMDCEKYAWATK